MKILYENCQVKDASDTSLPYTSYLVEYVKDGKVQYDVSVGDKKSELFDYYWDKYKQDLKKIDNTGGLVNPNRWDISMLKKPERKTRKRAKKKEEDVKEKKSEEGKE
tara:strand:- start:2907 stop:3227 length:321 start_codon:yes stop_codon:yes gene_type:complete